MKYILALLLTCWFAPTFAQDTYSFLSDRRFFEPTDLVGYQFVPQKMEIPQESKTTLKAGQVSFGITNKNLYVTGDGIKGVYNINNINSTDYGYKLALMNARNPASQGHLKVILTKGAYVDALVFKKDVNEKEIIFTLPEISAAGRAQEKAFFTDWGEVKIDYPEDIWGLSIRPFIRITQNPKIQQRLYASDSVSISFEHIITEIDKSKPKEEVIAGSLIEETVESREEVEEVESPVVAEAPKPKAVEESNDSPFFSSPKPKAEAQDIGSPFFSTPKPKAEESGNDSPFFSSPKKEKEEIAEEEEIVEEVAPEPEESLLKEDPDAIPPIGAEEVEKDRKRLKAKSKIKIIETYVIHIKTLMRYDDGTQEEKEYSYPIKKWEERVDETARAGEEKYQIEFQGEKDKLFYLYLTSERAISSFKWRNEKLLVRD